MSTLQSRSVGLAPPPPPLVSTSSEDEEWALTPIDDWNAETTFTSRATPAHRPVSEEEEEEANAEEATRTDHNDTDDITARPNVALSPSPLSESSRDEVSYTCPETLAEYSWYFAIGSMINPTSLALRKLHPVESYPGILRGWRLVFRADCGMASILPADSDLPSMRNHSQPRDDFHGVLHLLSKEQFAKLDVIESSYDRLEVSVECYDGKKQKAYVYMMAEEKLDPSKPDALPSERYVDIITRGCVHFGVRQEYIQWLRAHSCVKRKPPSEYRKIPVHELHQSGLKHLQMTAEELTKFDGRPLTADLLEVETEVDSTLTGVAYSPSPSVSPSSSPSISPSPSPSPLVCTTLDASPSPTPQTSRFAPLRIAVNKKILEWIGDLREPLLANTYEFMRFNFGGTDLTHSYTCVFFEPLYPIVSSYQEMSLEHRAMVEDIFYEKCHHPIEHLREWKLVGFLSAEEQKSSQQVGRAKLRQNRMGSIGGGGGGGIDGDNSDADGGALDFSNMFLSLSMEDHSGASSTCFAFCCAGAQPFHAQRVRDQQRSAGGGKYGGAGSARHVDHAHSRGRRHADRDRKRRHSIGNVGLHAQQAGASAAAAAAAASASTVANTPSKPVPSSDDAAATALASCRSPSSAMLPNAAVPRQRSQSICSGVLAASHTPRPSGISLCASPRRRGNSADDFTAAITPMPSPAQDRYHADTLGDVTIVKSHVVEPTDTDHDPIDSGTNAAL